MREVMKLWDLPAQNIPSEKENEPFQHYFVLSADSATAIAD